MHCTHMSGAKGYCVPKVNCTDNIADIDGDLKKCPGSEKSGFDMCCITILPRTKIISQL